MAKNPAGEVKTNKVQFKLTIMSYVIIEGRGRVRETTSLWLKTQQERLKPTKSSLNLL
jgi:hypothetical protein